MVPSPKRQPRLQAHAQGRGPPPAAALPPCLAPLLLLLLLLLLGRARLAPLPPLPPLLPFLLICRPGRHNPQPLSHLGGLVSILHPQQGCVCVCVCACGCACACAFARARVFARVW